MIEQFSQLMADETAREQLRKIPGVRAIGFGLKEKNGTHVYEAAYRVYVDQKKPQHELSSEEMIPPVINGLTTDVIVITENDLQTQCCNGPLRPGEQIARYMSDSTEVDGPDNIGTLGCFVSRNGTNYLLSNEHVIMGMTRYASDEIYHNKKDRTCNSKCNHPISHMQSNADVAPGIVAYRDIRPAAGLPSNMLTFTSIGHHSVQVDCAIGKLEPNVTFTNQTSEYGAINTSIRDLTGGIFGGGANPNTPHFPSGNTPLPLPADTAVQKKGRSTGFTHGNIIEIAREIHNAQTGNWGILWEIYVTSSEPNDNLDYEIEVHPDNHAEIPAYVAQMASTPVKAEDKGGGVIRIHGKAFSIKGDSGSLVVDNDRKPIGLLWGGKVTPNSIRLRVPYDGEEYYRAPVGITAITPIAAVFYKLNINPATGIIPVTGSTAGVLMPGQAISAEVDEGNRIHQRIENLRRLSANGKAVGSWILSEDNLFEEARHLVNHHRRCMVVWQRSKGPGFVAAMYSALGDEKGVFRKTVSGIPLETMLRNMRAALYDAGSTAMKNFLDAHGDEIISMAAWIETYDELTNIFSPATKTC